MSALLTLLIACTAHKMPGERPQADAEPKFTTLSANTQGYCARTTTGMALCWGTPAWPLFGLEDPADSAARKHPDDTWEYLIYGPGVSDKLFPGNDTVCWIDHRDRLVCGDGVPDYYSGARLQKYAPTLGGYAAVLLDGSIEIGGSWPMSRPPPGTVDLVADMLGACYKLPDSSWECSFYGPLGVRSSVDVVDSSGCALGLEGDVLCWTERRAEALVPDRVDWVEVRRGEHYACGITPERTVSCYPPTEVRERDESDWHGPVRAAEEPVIAMECVIMGGCCALLESGDLECWGVETWSAPPDLSVL